MAAAAKEMDFSVEEEGVVYGPLPLTPVQKWLLEGTATSLSQSMLLEVKEQVTFEDLRKAVKELVFHHDMFRARFCFDEDGQWNQTILEPNDVAINVHDHKCENASDVVGVIASAESQLNLVDTLYSVHLIEYGAQHRIYFAVHHIIIDLVSWRIILDDLESLLLGRPLPRKSWSFKRWALALEEHSNNMDPSLWKPFLHLAEESVWKHLRLLNHSDKPREFSMASFELSEQYSSLLDSCNKPYRTSVQDLILAGLLLSSHNVWGAKAISFSIEGHGREPWSDDIDISRTVGWFTSIYPLVIRLVDADIQNTLLSVKESLRHIPDRGLSYGLIKYLATETEANRFIKQHQSVDAAFNYVGRFQRNEDSDAFLKFADLGSKSTESAHGEEIASKMTHGMSVTASHLGDALQLRVMFDTSSYSADAIQKWGQQWIEAMKDIVAHCVDSRGALSLSDTPMIKSPSVLKEIQQALPQLGLGPMNVEAIFPATPLQSGLLLAMMRDASQYTVQIAYEVSGEFDLARFRTAWETTIRTHSILRTAFVSTAQGIYQVVHNLVNLLWNELPSWGPDEVDERQEEFLRQDRAKGFKITDYMYMRFAVASVRGTDRRRVIWTNFHAILDGWSLPIVFGDVLSAYLGHSLQLRPDFQRHVEYIQSVDRNDCQKFWAKSFSEMPPSTLLPFARPMSPEPVQFQSIKNTVNVSGKDLRDLTIKLQTTASIVMRAAWALTMRYYSRSDHVTFGCVVSGRESEVDDVERMVGMMINTIPVPVTMSADLTVAQFINALQTFHTESVPFSHVSLTDIQQWIAHRGSTPLIHSIAVFENYPVSNMPAGSSLSFSLKPTGGQEMVDSPLGLSMGMSGDTITKTITYDSALYHRRDVERLEKAFDRILSMLVGAKDGDVSENLSIGTICELSSAEREAIDGFSCGAVVSYPFQCLHHAFENVVAMQPDAIAVESGPIRVTYDDLNTRAELLAQALLLAGVTPGATIAVVIDRSIEMLVAFLSVLKAGATYTPIQETLPEDRMEDILSQLACSIVLTRRARASFLAEHAPDALVICVDELGDSSRTIGMKSKPAISGESLAYIIFTSGSTGKPKGVCVTHRGAMNAICSSAERMGLRSGTRISQLLAPHFDAAVLEYMGALSTGATLVLCGRDVLETLSTVDSVVITASALAQLDPSNLPNLKYITVGGEACPKHVMTRWIGKVNLNIGYGPTETSIQSHLHTVDENTIPGTIGRPIANTRSYILDERLNPVPVGVPGQLFIAGTGVSKGYLNEKELTSKAFMEDPWVSGEKMYRTGDSARWLSDGNIEFLGRLDDQVKIRGYRIELDEISKVLEEGAVTAAVTIVKSNQLVAFVTPADVDVGALRIGLTRKVPMYMVPAAIVPLESFPMTSNAKIDKKALAEMDVVLSQGVLETKKEKDLAKIWASVLNIDDSIIGSESSFFELGGDSISAARMAAACHNEGYALTVADVFKAPTLRDLASILGVEDLQDDFVEPMSLVSEEIREAIESEHLPLLNIDVSEVEDIYPTTALQAGLLTLMMKNPRAYAVQHIWQLKGDVDSDTLRAAIVSVVARNSILRTSFVSTPEGFYQVVSQDAHDPWTVTIEVPDEEFDETLHNYLEEDKELGFRITDKNLLRVAVIRTHPTPTHTIIATIHHALFDGWSVPIILSDLSAACQNVEMRSKDAFKAYVKHLLSHTPSDTEQFWRDTLGAISPSKPLADRDLSGTEGLENRYKMHSIQLQTSTADLAGVARRTGVTGAMFMNAAWSVVLRMYHRSDDVIFGNVFSGRDSPVRNIERTVGMFICTVPICVSAMETMTADGLLTYMKDFYASCLPHSHASLVDIQSWANVEAGSRLFHTLLVFQNLSGTAQGTEAGTAPFELNVLPSGGEAHEFELEVVIAPGPEKFTVMFHYDANLISEDKVLHIANEFDNIVKRLAESAGQPGMGDQPLSEVGQLSRKQQLAIEAFQVGPIKPLAFECIHHAIEHHAKFHPDAPAVESLVGKLTYKELDWKANVLANRLRAVGLTKGSIVPIVMDRSIEFIVSIVAVLKAGGCYVPVDTKIPAARITYILRETACKVILTVHGSVGASAIQGEDAFHVIYVDELLRWGLSDYEPEVLRKPFDIVSGTDKAYCIFTSGTTGKPKGVVVPHRGVINIAKNEPGFVQMFKDKLDDPLRESYVGKRVAQFFALSFDGAIMEIFMTLCNGATLVLCGHESIELLKTVDVLLITPTGLTALEPSEFPNLKSLIVAGEACSSALVKKWAHRVRMFNAYGPAEVTVCVSFSECNASKPIGIGSPLANRRCYVLDNERKPVPIGVAGELYVGGLGVADGYLNRPDLTSASFVEDPFVEDDDSQPPRMYATGDHVRWLPNGELEFMGRKDDQVKIRGYRIELSEVGLALSKYVGVEHAIAFAHNNMIVAFVSPQTVDVDALRRHMWASLPAYMVPSIFKSVAEFPRNSNGKVDKPKLLETCELTAKVKTIVEPRDETESALYFMVATLIPDVTDLSVEDDLFAVGMNSMTLVRLAKSIHDNLGKLIPIPMMFRLNTIEMLAQYIRDETDFIIEDPLIEMCARAEQDLDGVELLKNVDWVNAQKLRVPYHKMYRRMGRKVFLTGATGFLGLSLLYSLLESGCVVYCLVRAKTVKDGLNRLKKGLEQREGWKSTYDQQVKPVIGSLEEAHYGLSDAAWEELTLTVDIVVHNGAIVHGMRPLHNMYRANVGGTETAVELATSGQIKHLHFVGTLSVFNQPGTITEKTIPTPVTLEKGAVAGYPQSKYLAERAVQILIDRGFPATVYRLGRIGGHSQLGVSALEDTVTQMVVNIVELGMYPKLIPFDFNSVPVDICAKLIISTTHIPDSAGKYLHIVCPSQTPDSKDFARILARFGYRSIQGVSVSTWRKALMQRAREDKFNALHLIVANMPSIKITLLTRLFLKLPRFTSKQTCKFYAENGIPDAIPDLSFGTVQPSLQWLCEKHHISSPSVMTSRDVLTTAQKAPKYDDFWELDEVVKKHKSLNVINPRSEGSLRSSLSLSSSSSSSSFTSFWGVSSKKDGGEKGRRASGTLGGVKRTGAPDRAKRESAKRESANAKNGKVDYMSLWELDEPDA
ncbi:hypothetical protein HK102_000591 [Quaeritorhiza haematococci]|nr:hypothetical protein HK102_000591 [Quaeritorhiza haematococci]